MSVLTETFDLKKMSQTWKLRSENVDPAAFRVLRNLLVARQLDVVHLSTLDEQQHMNGEARLLKTPPLFPERFQPLPFEVEAEAPEQSTCARSFQIQFRQPPPKEIKELAYQVLERWALLPALGGYAPEDVSPERSVTVPDIPILLDPITVEQGFQEIFECDEAAFDAAINWAVGLHGRHAIRRVCIS